MTEDFNKETTDKGWAAMRQLLDQEMPEEQKRRRIFWWWFTLLLLPITAFGGWQLWHKGGPVPKPAIPVHAIPPTPLPMAQQSTNRLETVQKESVTTAAGRAAESETVSVPDVKNQKTVKSHSASTPKIASTSPQTKFAISPEAPQNTYPTTTTASANTYTEDNHSGTTKPVSPFMPLSITPGLVEILQRGIPSPSLHVEAVVSPEKLVKPQKKSAAWQFGLAATMGTERFSRINNLGGGAVIDWKIGRRLGIRSGLHYSRYTPSNMVQVVALVRPQEYVSAADSGFTVTDGFGNVVTPVADLQETVLIPFSRLHMLELPVMASWRVYRGFRVYSGLNTTFVMLAKTSDNSYSGSLKLATNSDQASRNLNSLAVGDLERWRYDAQLGVGYQWNRRFEIGLFAKFPLQALSAGTSKLEYAGTGNFWPSSTPSLVNQRITSFTLNATCFF